ncbi:hypothetical protein SASPL_134602 [Salvia splendens]|uniref:non-specific serine/threonine protein kinase n=1 Tax=Salvia splendens TaxID=180675 RepID=A0A8X8WX50_SALSN|nr:hypothetical protein SASPL_134602 [Salvia splendens]
MGCFSCISHPSKDMRDYNGGDIDTNSSVGGKRKANVNGSVSVKKGGATRAKGQDGNNPSKGNAARSFTFKDLALATQNFREANLIGEGGFGSVYKGRLESGLVVAVKQLNLEGLQGNQEFIVEVLMLSLLHHPNLVNLIGYCTDGDQRLLVYEFMQMGSLENHLFGENELKYKRNLDAKDCRPYLKDRRKYIQMVDPLLEGRFSIRSLHHAVAITAMCLQEQASFRPLIGDIVLALEFLASQADDSRRGQSHSRTSSSPSQVDKADSRRQDLEDPSI